METIASLKWLGPGSVLLTWLAIGFILRAIPRNITRSISHHAAGRRKEYLVFAVLMTLAVLSMSLFLLGWFAPAFRLPLAFSAVALLAVVLELIATWVPLTTGLKFTVHQLCSYGAAWLMPVLMFIIALSPEVDGAGRYLDLAGLTIFVFFMFLFVFVKKSRDYYLWFQSAAIVSFHVALLGVTYLG